MVFHILKYFDDLIYVVQMPGSGIIVWYDQIASQSGWADLRCPQLKGQCPALQIFANVGLYQYFHILAGVLIISSF